jgi:hypothetical protein
MALRLVYTQNAALHNTQHIKIVPSLRHGQAKRCCGVARDVHAASAQQADGASMSRPPPTALETLLGAQRMMVLDR